MTDLSIILTAYNVETYIAVAVQSAWDALGRLDGVEAEVLVVDDGSDDATPEILATLADRFAGRAPLDVHRFAENTPGGTAAGSNYGLDRARGDLIVFLDGDDWVRPDGLADAVRAMQAGDHDLLVTDCAEYWNDTGAYTKWPEDREWDRLAAGTAADRRRALLHMAPFPWRKIYRRAFLDGAGIRFPEGDFFFEDNPFHWETTLRARSWGWLRRETHVHRRARAGQSLEREDGGYLAIFDHYDTIAGILDRTGTRDRHAPDLTDWLARHLAWAAGRLAPGHWPALFGSVRTRLATLPREDAWAAIRRADADPRLGPPGAALLQAALLDDWRGFLRHCPVFRTGRPRDQDRG